jgi:uncharacterized membrane protein
MPRPGEFAARSGDQRGLDRVLAFGDAVVAIAITLVVLPLVDTAMDAASPHAYLADGWSEIGSAAISFVVIAAFWRAHHWLFVPATGYSSAVLANEVVWLAAIVVLPVVTVLDVAAGDADRLGLGLYIGTLLVASLALRVESVVLRRGGFLEGVPRESALGRWIGAGLMALALGLALLDPRPGALWLLLLLLERPLLRLAHR